MASSRIPVILLVINIALCVSIEDFTSGVSPTEAEPTLAKRLTQLALAVARATYLPIPDNHFLRNGSIMENPADFSKVSFWLKCPPSKPDMDAGLCYKTCKRRASWAFSEGVGPVCWGCPRTHPVEQGALCYKRCPTGKPNGRTFLCFGNCPQGYRNLGLTCLRHVDIRAANNNNCPWYDKCGLTLSRGCSKCPAGYRNDGCTCRRNPHIVARPRYNRGIGVVMRSYGRGVGRLPTFFHPDPTSEREACRVKGWVGKAFVNEDTEVIKFTNDRQKIVVFGFRGTEFTSIRDWLTSFNLHPVDFWLSNTKLTTHRGFKNRYDNIANWFEKEFRAVPSDYITLLTGHSLGGAEASIAAVFAAGKLGRAPDAVVTWGSPLAGAENFVKFYKTMVGCNVTMTYVTKGDLVASLPKVYGYRHVCDSVELEPRAEGFFRVHSLYTGYGDGVERKYGDSEEIKLGCDVLMKNDKNSGYVFGY